MQLFLFLWKQIKLSFVSFFLSGQSHSRPVNVVVNAFPVESILAEYVWFSYHVDYNPPVDSKRVRCALIEDHRALIGDTRAFDGMKLIIPRKLHDNV